MKCVANLEAHIDFEETESLDKDLLEQVAGSVRQLRNLMNSHLEDGRRGERLKNGVRAIILGEPNVGKSSLLNLLCK